MRGELYLRVQLGMPHSDAAAVLERHLGEKRAWAYTLEMWDWFATRHPEGQITGPDAAYLIAKNSGWDGEADKFCAAQVLAGYLAAIPEGFRVRGWEKWAGFYYTVKAKEQAKKAKQREVVPGMSPSESPGCPRDVPGTQHENEAPKPTCPGDPSHISSIKHQEGVQGEGRRTRLVSPFAAGQDPTPVTTAVLAALHERGIDAAPPSARSEGRVETALAAVGVETAVARLAEILADPAAQRPLTYHVDALKPRPKPKRNLGDLGVDLSPWWTRLKREDRERAQAELHALAAIDPDLEDAPLGIPGGPHSPAYEQLRALNEKWRAVAEATA